MVECNACGKDLYLGFTCRRCGEQFCSKHRLPENHDCPMRGLKSEEVALKIQLEKNNRSSASSYQEPKKLYQGKSKVDRDVENFFDDDDEYERQARFPFRIDLSLNLIIFIVLAVTDVFYIAMAWNFPPIYLPLIVHAVFMPILIFLAYKQKKGTLEPEMILVFFKSMVLYMIVYIAVKIVVAVISVNILSIFINVIIGGFMIFIWWRIIKQLQMAF